MAKSKLDIEITAHQYAEDIRDGKIPACEYVKLSVKRYFDDLKNGHKRGLWFDEKAAIKPIKFVSLLAQFKGEFAGKRLILEPWQQFIFWNIFGWKRDDGTRRFRRAKIEVARKNGKTTIMGGLGDYMLIADNESGAEIYSAATKRDQAREVFEAAQNMLKGAIMPELREMVKHFRSNMNVPETYSKFEPLSSDSGKQDGTNPSCGIVDEYHAHKDDSLLNVLESGMGARKQPLTAVITTAGFNKNSACFQDRQIDIKILEGQLEDDSTFVIIYSLDKEDDWKDPDVWIKANPNLGVSVKTEYIQERVNLAKINPMKEVDVKTKNLNLWTDAAETWIKDDIWMKGNIPVNPEELIGESCYVGIDISEKYDICAAVADFFLPDGSVKSLTKFWIPEAAVELYKDKVPYKLWASQGLIEIIEGNTVDQELVIDQVLEWSTKYDILSLGYDEWNSAKFVTDLIKKGFPEVKLNKVTQYLSTLSEPTKLFYEKVLDGNFHHGGCAVMRWMVSNAVTKADANNNYRLDKSKSQNKIDGLSATINAFAEYLSNKENASIYDDEDQDLIYI